ncbi:hypothetical protein EMIT0210MI2_11166 [Priestia megaterium]|jgi:hypothetical protein
MPINSFENYPMSWKPSVDKTRKPIYQAIAGQLEQEYYQGSFITWNKTSSTERASRLFRFKFEYDFKSI